MKLEVKWLTGKDDLTDVRRVRDKVFIDEQGIDPSLEYDATDAVAEHLLLLADGVPVGAARLYRSEGQQRFGRLAVLPAYRGRHLGIMLVERLLARAFGAGAEEVHIHAQAYLEGFYTKLGFVTYGEPFEEAGIPHISMIAKRGR